MSLAKSSSEEAAEWPICAATGSQTHSRGCQHPLRDLGSVGWPSARGTVGTAQGAGVSGCVPRDGKEYCCQRAREPQSILRTDFEAHIVFIWMLLLKKSLACFLVKEFAEMFPLPLQLRPEKDGSTRGAWLCTHGRGARWDGGVVVLKSCCIWPNSWACAKKQPGGVMGRNLAVLPLPLQARS